MLHPQQTKVNKLNVFGPPTRRHFAIAGLCSLSFAWACSLRAGAGSIAQGAEKPALAETRAQSPTEVIFQTLRKGSRSGVRDPRQVILRSQAEWNTLWAQHISGDFNPPPPPAIDFTRNLVVAVFLGEKPTGGYDIAITRAQHSGGAVVVYYRERSPAPGAMVTQSLTQPFHIVLIDTDVNSMVTFRRES